MKRFMISAGLLAALYSVPANAGSLDLPPQPIVTPPAQPLFSWTGPYAGISAGTTRTKRKRNIIERGQDTRPYTKADAFFNARDRGLKSFAPEGASEHRAHCQAFDYINRLNCGAFAADDYILGEFNREEYFGEDRTDDSIREQYGNVLVSDRDPVVTEEWERVVGTETVRENHSTLGIFAGYRWQTASDIVLGGELGYHHYNSTGSFETKAQLGYAINRALPYLTAGYDFAEKSVLYGVGFDYALTDRWIAGVEYTHADKTGTDRVSARLGFKF